jgi:flagellar hook-basal body complex protein FliE
MAIPPIGAAMPLPSIAAPGAAGGLGAIGPAAGATAPGAAPAAGFGEALGRGLEQVSALENNAEALIQDVATGGDTKIHEVMAATSQASLATDLLVQVRDRALESYHEVMRLQL